MLRSIQQYKTKCAFHRYFVHVIINNNIRSWNGSIIIIIQKLLLLCSMCFPFFSISSKKEHYSVVDKQAPTANA